MLNIMFRAGAGTASCCGSGFNSGTMVKFCSFQQSKSFSERHIQVGDIQKLL
jgi:hypothetical protein